MLTIEPGDPIPPTTCADCGGKTTTLIRWVYKDGDAYAAYYVRFGDKHPTRELSIAVGIGEWGEEASPSDRVSFALVLRPGRERNEVMVVDAAQSPWKHAKVFGRMLDRKEALEHPRLQEVFHITDHMVVDDHELRAYLEADSTNA